MSEIELTVSLSGALIDGNDTSTSAADPNLKKFLLDDDLSFGLNHAPVQVNAQSWFLWHLHVAIFNSQRILHRPMSSLLKRGMNFHYRRVLDPTINVD